MTSTLLLLVAVLMFSDSFALTTKEANNTIAHALFYQYNTSNLKFSNKKKLFGDVLLNEVNEITSTTLYYENATSSEEVFTTENVDYGTTTEPENETDTSLYPNQTEVTPTEQPWKKKLPKHTYKEKFCHCDLTFHSCDVNCCCDADCTDEEQTLFSHCLEIPVARDERFCYPQIFYYKNNTASKIVMFDTASLFCILKDNSPDKRITERHKKITDPTEAERLIEQFYKWRGITNNKKDKFKWKSYTYGDAIWLLQDSKVVMFDIPFPSISHYCQDRTPAMFLRNVDFKCIVKFGDLEMFNVYKNINNTVLVSVPLNKSHEDMDVTNCSSVSCVQWILLICDNRDCAPYNQTIHYPSCNDSKCTNIATRIQYTLHCHGSNITKAVTYLHVKAVDTDTPYLQQEISIKYYLENETQTTVLELSGNPGYMIGKPIITSRVTEQEKFDIFSINTFPLRNILSYPKNVEGLCVLSNSTYNVINFGYDIKSNCLYKYRRPKIEYNGTVQCNQMQNELFKYLKLNTSEKIMISPLGNPSLVSNDDWVELMLEKPIKPVRGELLENNTLLSCHDMVLMISYEFTYSNITMSGIGTQTNRKILRSIVRHEETESVVFEFEEDIEVMIRTTLQFFDITKPANYEYAKGPYLNLHVPSDFFYPFTSKANRIAIHFIYFTAMMDMCVFLIYY